MVLRDADGDGNYARGEADEDEDGKNDEGEEMAIKIRQPCRAPGENTKLI
jgi:hypothetical protein